MAIDLASAWQKLRWGSMHFHAMVDEITRWNNTHVRPTDFRVAHRYDSVRGGLCIRAYWDLEIPQEWSMIFGDAIAGYRNALDHLAWAAVVGGSRPESLENDRTARRVDFPLSEKTTRENLEKKLPGVENAVLDVILDAQPSGRADDPLRWLRELSNEDKHRQISIVHGIPVGLEMDYTTTGMIVTGPPSDTRQLIDQGRMVHERFVPGHPAPGAIPNLRPFPESVVLGHVVASLGVEAEAILLEIERVVTEILAAVEDILTPPDAAPAGSPR